MVWREIKIKPIDITDAILLYTEEILTEDKCKLFIFTKDNEYEEISKETENLENGEDFAKWDLFIVLIRRISCNRERLQPIRFKNTYSKKTLQDLGLIDFFFKGFDFVKNKKLSEIFGNILAIGNYMKGVAAKSDAFAI